MLEKTKKYLIVNADDFGMTEGISKGIIEAHKKGIVTSTSLMVYENGSNHAGILAKQNPGLSVGLHGVLRTRGPNPTISVNAYIESLERQLGRFERILGRLPTHFDTHAVPLVTPASALASFAFAQKYHLPFRGNQKKILRYYGMRGLTEIPKNISAEALSKTLKGMVQGQVYLLVCHPGYTSLKLKDPYRLPRTVELKVLTSKIINSLIKKESIKLVNYNSQEVINL